MSPCPLCIEAMGEDAATFCVGHDESTQRLAYALAAMFQDPPITTEKASWFIEDAEGLVGPDLPEGDGWVVEKLPDLPSGDITFTVNGVQFFIDMAAEGYSHPQAIAEYRPDDWDDDEEPSPSAARQASETTEGDT